MNQQYVIEDSVRRVIDNYTPRGIDLYHWLALEQFVRQAVLDSNPTEPNEARRRMTLVSALSEWVGYQACFPVERTTVFDLDVMSEFIDTGNAWTPKVKKMARGRLKTMAKRLNPAWPPELPEETAYTSAWDPQPYTANEQAALHGWVRGQRTETRRIKAGVLLAFALGAGLHTHEIARLRVRDITVDGEGVLVKVSGQNPRQVPVRSDHEDVLTALVANVPGEHYAFGPGRTHAKPRVVRNFISDTNNESDVRPNPRRMRATWIVEHIKAGVPAPILVQATGLTNLRSFERWLYTVPGFSQDAYRETLREIWRQKTRSHRKNQNGHG